MQINKTLPLPFPASSHSTAMMDSTSASATASDAEVVLDSPPYFRLYKDGRAERFMFEDFVPPNPTADVAVDVSSKDITIDAQTGLSARLYLPTHLLSAANANKRVPLLIYFHGGAFIIGSPFCRTYHNYLNSQVAAANVAAISVRYRRAPEHPLPAAYEDCWAAVQWAVAHGSRSGPEPWLSLYADFGRVFLAGDSAGANIAHNMAMAAGQVGLDQMPLGVCMIHPFFWGSRRIGLEEAQPARVEQSSKVWPIVCPSAFLDKDGLGHDDPWFNPVAEGAPSLAGLGCRRVLVCVAEEDFLKDRGRAYFEGLSNSGWLGVVEIREDEGEDHVFHLRNPDSHKAKEFIELLAAFFNRGMPPLPL